MHLWYWALEILSCIVALGTSTVLLHWGFGVLDSVSVLAGWNIQGTQGVYGVGFSMRMQIFAALMCFGTLGLSIGAADAAKKLGDAVYKYLNHRYHQWFVVGTNGVMFLALGVVAYKLGVYMVVTGLAVSLLTYIVLKNKFHMSPDSLVARLGSVVLVRAPIGFGLALLVPYNKFGAIIGLVTTGAIIVAMMHLLSEQKRYRWPTR